MPLVCVVTGDRGREEDGGRREGRGGEGVERRKLLCRVGGEEAGEGRSSEGTCDSGSVNVLTL